MSAENDILDEQPAAGTPMNREVNSVLIAASLVIITYIAAKWAVPQVLSEDLHGLLSKFVGVSLPFFFTVLVYLYYAIGAWIVETFALAIPRRWSTISQALHWMTEACPLVGLLTTFLSLLLALITYGEAGPGKPETQAAFISQFAIAFGSSIAGGLLALIAFTLHRLIPEDEED